MLSMTVTDIRTFMKNLLSGTAFDSFYMIEARVRMGITYDIDGRLNKDFYDSDQAITRDYCLWKEVRDYLFQIIKGTRLPTGMKIVLALPPAVISHLVGQCGGSFRTEEVDGMYLNILFSPDQLLVTSGISYHCFTMDRALEHVFDDYIRDFFTRLSLYEGS